ncbi:MAG: hypothetical protein M3270_00450 [Thermoproteota archaeon]|nr:hypothetical protein [Thermoproteota archaeon]
MLSYRRRNDLIRRTVSVSRDRIYENLSDGGVPDETSGHESRRYISSKKEEPLPANSTDR